MKRRLATIAALAVALLPVGAADGSRLVRFTTTSRHVNPADPQVTFNDTHRPGIPKPSSLPVNVLLPDGYDGKRRFPVLFLLHGHGDTYDSWIEPEHGDLEQIAPHFPGIVVMPEAGRGWYTNWWNGGERGHPGWERYHLDELLPLIQRRFRILSGRRWHAIAGLSMGGEGAMYYAEQRPGYFGSVASFSGVLDIQRPEWPNGFDTQGENYQDVYGDPNAQEFYSAGHNPTALAANLKRTRVFVAVGDGTTTQPGEVSNYFGALAESDLRQQALDFVSAAQQAGVDVTYDPHHGIHDWPYWREYLQDALKWDFFRNSAPDVRRWDFSTISQTSRPWGLTIHFRKPPTQVAIFDRSDRFLIGDGSGNVTIRNRGGKPVTVKLPFNIHYPPAG